VKADQPMSLEATLIVMNAYDRSMGADTERQQRGGSGRKGEIRKMR
jgi:hypothetical protein